MKGRELAVRSGKPYPAAFRRWLSALGFEGIEPPVATSRFFDGDFTGRCEEQSPWLSISESSGCMNFVCVDEVRARRARRQVAGRSGIRPTKSPVESHL